MQPEGHGGPSLEASGLLKPSWRGQRKKQAAEGALEGKLWEEERPSVGNCTLAMCPTPHTFLFFKAVRS